MDKWDFLRWGRTLAYTQEEAAEKLGVTRSTINNWERGATRIPKAIDLACHELTRRWKQRADFGPVNLVYSDGRMSSRVSRLRCELFSNNDAAINQAFHLMENVINPLIIEDGGSVVWSASELLRECERRRDESHLDRPPLKPRTKPKGDQPGASNGEPK